MKTVAIIAIGDELLNGFTIDSNSHWLKEYIHNFKSFYIKICKHT